MPTLAEKIVAKKEQLVGIKDRLTEIKGLIEEADEPVSEEIMDEVNTLSDEETSIIKSIESLEKIETGIIATVTPAIIARRDQHKSGDSEDNKDLLFKAATAQFIAHVSKSRPDAVAANIYKGDDRVEAVLKTAVAPADSTTSGWAAELVRQSYGAFLDDLRGVSVFAALRAQSMALDFAGGSTLKVPRRDLSGSHGTDLAGAFVGELGVIPVKKMGLTSQTLSRYKMAVISTMSEEIMSQAVPSIEAIIRKGMIDDTAQAIDTALLDASAAVAGVRPAGLAAGVTLTASTGATSANIIADLKVLLTAMSTANLGAKPVLIMNTQRLLGLSTVTNAVGQFAYRDEIASGLLMGIPVVASTHVPAATVLIVDADSFVSATDMPEFKLSDQTVLTMANSDGTAPTQAGDATDFTAGDLGTAEQVPPKGGIIVDGNGTGAPTGTSTTNYQAMSMYQQNAVALRMILPMSWGLVRSGSVAGLKTVGW